MSEGAFKMKTSIEFEFTIGEQVKIIAINQIGRVEASCILPGGKQHQVVYWMNGTRCSVWMFEYEIVSLS